MTTNMLKTRIVHIGDPRKGKQWTRRITGVDKSKTNGYAFQGEFLSEGEVELPVGAVLLQVGALGSYKHPDVTGVVKRVAEDGSLALIAQHPYKEEFISLREAVQEALGLKPNPLARFSTEEMKNELRNRGEL